MESVEGMDGKNHFKSGTSGFLCGWWSKPLLSLKTIQHLRFPAFHAPFGLTFASVIGSGEKEVMIEA